MGSQKTKGLAEASALPGLELATDEAGSPPGHLGHRALSCDLTLPGDPLPSLRVLVPGLCAMGGRIATDRFRRLCPDAPAPHIPEPF